MKTSKIKVYSLLILLSLLITQCGPDMYEEIPTTYIPESLEISEKQGIKLQSYVVTDQVAINVKLPKDGTYKIKIVDISGKMVSQEKLTAKEGDNILKMYVKSLPISSYRIQLLDNKTGDIFGTELFAISN